MSYIIKQYIMHAIEKNICKLNLMLNQEKSFMSSFGYIYVCHQMMHYIITWYMFWVGFLIWLGNKNKLNQSKDYILIFYCKALLENNVTSDSFGCEGWPPMLQDKSLMWKRPLVISIVLFFLSVTRQTSVKVKYSSSLIAISEVFICQIAKLKSISLHEILFALIAPHSHWMTSSMLLISSLFLGLWTFNLLIL